MKSPRLLAAKEQRDIECMNVEQMKREIAAMKERIAFISKENEKLIRLCHNVEQQLNGTISNNGTDALSRDSQQRHCDISRLIKVDISPAGFIFVKSETK